MPLPLSAYAQDEDLAIILGADFTDILPRDQLSAAGTDGSFSSVAPWILGSATIDFVAQGVAPGMLALVSAPPSGTLPKQQQFVVDTVGPGGLTLRRKGQASGVGQPPAGPGGGNGITFVVATATPQLIRASYDLNRRFGVDDLVWGRRTSDLYDPQELVDATVLTVAWKLYTIASRQGGTDAAGGRADAYWTKALQAKRDLDELLGRVALHWQAPATNLGIEPPTTRFSARLSR